MGSFLQGEEVFSGLAQYGGGTDPDIASVFASFLYFLSLP